MSLFDDTYLTIDKPCTAIFKDKGSKFIGYAYPVMSQTEVKDLLAKIKSEHSNANHHCWAVRFGTDRSVFKLNDDGEPSGTAGRPILNVLLSKNLTNILVIVVRYFGGTLLGVPGLINAYKSTTELTVNAGQIVEQIIKSVYAVSFNYLQMNEVMKIVKDEQLEILDQQFDNDCLLTLAIRLKQLNQVLPKLEYINGVNCKLLSD